MSAFTRYAAHAELLTIIHAREDTAMLAEMHATDPTLFAYPVSGDSLAVVQRGTKGQKHRRRSIAQAGRRGGAA